MIILGIDPGSVVLGYGAIQSHGPSTRLVEYGVIRPKLKQQDFNLRLLEIYNDLSKVVKRVAPNLISIETMFYHKNVQSLMKLAQARAITVLVSVQNNIPIIEYSPREVKKSITGRGNASKQQVQFFVRSMLNIEITPEFYDVTDALAIALCHNLKGKSSRNTTTKSVKSWKDFVEQNPDRII